MELASRDSTFSTQTRSFASSVVNLQHQQLQPASINDVRAFFFTSAQKALHMYGPCQHLLGLPPLAFELLISRQRQKSPLSGMRVTSRVDQAAARAHPGRRGPFVLTACRAGARSYMYIASAFSCPFEGAGVYERRSAAALSHFPERALIKNAVWEELHCLGGKQGVRCTARAVYW